LFLTVQKVKDKKNGNFYREYENKEEQAQFQHRYQRLGVKQMADKTTF
jgi:hypothetical protein